MAKRESNPELFLTLTYTDGETSQHPISLPKSVESFRQLLLCLPFGDRIAKAYCQTTLLVLMYILVAILRCADYYWKLKRSPLSTRLASFRISNLRCKSVESECELWKSAWATIADVMPRQRWKKFMEPSFVEFESTLLRRLIEAKSSRHRWWIRTVLVIQTVYTIVSGIGVLVTTWILIGVYRLFSH